MDFKEEDVNVVSKNLRKPGGRIPDTDHNAPEGATIATQPFLFGAKIRVSLTAACDLVRYYRTVGRSISVSNIR